MTHAAVSCGSYHADLDSTLKGVCMGYCQSGANLSLRLPGTPQVAVHEISRTMLQAWLLLMKCHEESGCIDIAGFSAG